ncbi:MAG: efflux RND transporter periplasmic adaptor subunit [Treponema sp.]|nr:efflux RND transporter periplasmic adaptor subunit [Treponema sp.]
MKNTKKLFLQFTLFAFIVLSFVSCSKNDSAQEEEEESEKLVQAVRVEALEKSDLRKFIEINGSVRAEKSTSVFPVIQGKIASSRAHLGSYVKKGDVIAYVDPSVPGSRYALNEVTAPISGTVISIPLKEGTKVNTESSIVTIGDLSKLQITAYIPERYVAFLNVGLEADVMLEAFPDEKFKAKVSEVSPVLDEASRAKEIILTFVENDQRINAGMFAALNLYLKEFKDVFSVPTSCIVEKDGKKFIYLIDNSDGKKVRFTQIKTGEEIVDRTIIEFAEESRAFIDASEKASSLKVVTQGFENLEDGSIVNIAD